MQLPKEFSLSPTARKCLKDPKALKSAIASGRTILEIVGFSNETMAKFYGMARQLFEEKRYTDAVNAFTFLVGLDPKNHDYWLGLGMAEQMTQDFEGAVDAYEMAAIRELDNPIPYFYLAKCLFALHERDCALSAIELAIEYSGEDERYALLHQQAQDARSLLIRELREEET